MDVYLRPEDLQPGDLEALEKLLLELPRGEFHDFIDHLHHLLSRGIGVHIYSKEKPL